MQHSLFAHHKHDDTGIWLAFEYINVFMYVDLSSSSFGFIHHAGNCISSIRYGYTNMFNYYIAI